MMSAATIPTDAATTKPHVITFGKWMTVKWNVGANETDVTELKIRPLYVDGRLREYVLGPPHEITERIFVVRRAFRINDDLPGESSTTPHWIWQRGGWIVVDRTSGHSSQINFPGFDPYQSVGEWYRDYFAYCATENKKIFAVVTELGHRKPIAKQPLGEIADNNVPDSLCASPAWQRQPARVTFQSKSGQKISFTVRGNFAGEAVSQDEDKQDEDKEDKNDDDDSN